MILASPTRALIWREIRVTLWRWRTFVIVVIWMLCAFGVPYTMWPDGTMAPFQFAARAREMIVMLCAMVLVGIGLTVPATAAVSIAGERDEESIDQLRLTLLTDGGLVRGKAISSLLLSLLLFIGVFPVFSIVQFIVGLDVRQSLQIFGYLLVFSLTCAIGGVACSTLFRRTLVAVAIAYLCISVVIFLPAFSIAPNMGILFGFGGARRFGPFAGNFSLSPIGVIFRIVAYGMESLPYAIACAVPLLVSAVLYKIAVWKVSRVTDSAGVPGEKPVDDQAVLRARRTQFPFYLIDPLRRKPVIADGKNPMTVREIRWGLFSRGTWMVRVFYGTFILFIFPMLGACMSNYTSARVGVMTVQMVMLIFAAPVLAGSAWTKEREQGNIDMIRMTLLRARELYLGKAAGSIMALAPVVAALYVTTLPAFIWHFRDFSALVCGCLTLSNCAIVALAISLYTSIVCRRTTTAIAAGVVLCCVVFFGFYVAGSILFWSNFATYTGEAPYMLRTLSPITSYAETFGASVRTRSRQGALLYNYYGWAQSQMAFTGMAGGFLAMSIYRLTRREMRDP